MKLERFNFSEKKIWKGFLYGFIVAVVLMVVMNLFTSKAKYKTTESIPLVRGKISYKPADLNVVAMYQQNESGEYESIDTIPSSGYELNASESYCEVNKVKDESITIEYSNSKILIDNLTKKGTKCYLYFDKKLGNTMSEILAGYTKSTRSSYNAVITDTTTKKVYSVADDLGTSLYFAGAPTDNWVSFGGFYWRIIRMNGDGSTRLIYAGTSPTTSGDDDQIGTSYYNSNSDDNAYVGYMYGTTGASSYENAHANNNNSTIKGNLDIWYDTYLNKAGVAEYIDGNAGFCNDRSINSGNGYGTNSTYYSVYNRLYTNKAPSLKCTNTNDLFTTGGSSRGNGKLTNPIGLITADEVAYAGGVWNTTNQGYYLYTGQSYWTMSPYNFNATTGSAYVSFVVSSGELSGYSVGNMSGVRPAINLKADTQFIGEGTTTSPFQVV